MPLDHLRGREIGARRDIGEIGRDAFVVADRQAPGPPGGLARAQALRQLGDPRGQRRVRQQQRIVVDHERAERRHAFDDAGDLRLGETPRQRQHQRAEPAIDAVAELDAERRIACRKQPVVGHDCGSQMKRDDPSDERSAHSAMAGASTTGTCGAGRNQGFTAKPRRSEYM